MGLRVNFPSPSWDFYLGCICAVSLYVLSPFLSSCVSASCVWNMLFPWRHSYLWLLSSFLPPLCSSLGLEGEGSDKDIPFRTELSEVLHALHTVQVRVSVLISIYCKKL